MSFTRTVSYIWIWAHSVDSIKSMVYDKIYKNTTWLALNSRLLCEFCKIENITFYIKIVTYVII